MPYKEFSEIEKAWLAAAIDGEGHIEFSRHSQRQGVIASIIISNTDIRFLKRIEEIVGIGNGRIKERAWDKRATKQPMVWQISGLQNCSFILKQILPYLIIKADKAKQLILFADYRLTRKKDSWYGAYEKAILKGDIKKIEEIRRLL